MENVVNHLGDPVSSVKPTNGFYKQGTHFYCVNDGGIVHINIAGHVINRIDTIFLAKYETLDEISQEIFECELRNVIFELGIYQYVK